MTQTDLYEQVSQQLGDDKAVLASRMDAQTFGALWAERARASEAVSGGRRLLTAHGMICASVERHFADSGTPHWVRPQLVSDAAVAGWAEAGPLREVLADYVRGPDFLGSTGELTFKAKVIIIGSAYREALNALRPLTDPVAWDAADAVDRMAWARAQFELANATHRTQARAPVEDRRDLPTGSAASSVPGRWRASATKGSTPPTSPTSP